MWSSLDKIVPSLLDASSTCTPSLSKYSLLKSESVNSSFDTIKFSAWSTTLVSPYFVLCFPSKRANALLSCSFFSSRL